MSVDYDHLLTDLPGTPSMSAGALIKTRRVLVVSYDFPPNRTSAVYRMTGLTKYLTQFGWQPTVLTIRVGGFAQEPKLLEKLPSDIDVVRTRYVRINAWENAAASAVQSAGGLQSTSTSENHERRFDRYLRSLGELVRSTFYFPDDSVGWVPFGLSSAIRLHRKQPFDAVYTTSPPRSAPVIGLILKTLYGIPWVSEFMDPWYPPKGRIRRKSEDLLQAKLLLKADRVVVMVRQHAEELRRLFNVPSEKLAVVRNGFFEEDFASLETTEKSPLDPGHFHLSHFGSIYPDNFGNFFSALTDLVRESPELRKRLRVNIVGFPCEGVLHYAREGDLKDIIKIHGFLADRADALQMMRASDCLLLFWGRPDFSRLAVAGKTYDYLRIGRPILALTGEGGVKELVEEAQAGWAVPPENTEAIKQALKTVIAGCRKDDLPRPPRPEFVAQFRWDHLAQKLAGVLQEAVSDAR